MNRRSVFAMLIFLLPFITPAQVVMQPQAPPLGLTIKPQLWNLALVNGTKESLDVRIEMVMTDVSNNQRVLSASTRRFFLSEGAKQVQVKDVMPITYNAGSSVVVDPSPDGFLPVGVFNICYTLIGGAKGVPEATIAEVCETYEIEPLSPPQLITPANQEVLTIPRPFFSWLPPVPVNSFSRIQYDLLLVEVQPTQSAADAIQMNPPVFSRQRVEFTSFQYPQSSPALDTGKVYAWRISARNNQVNIANSETATFTVSNEKADSSTDLTAIYYSKLQPAEDAAFAVCNGTLRFLYENLNNQQQLPYKLYDLSNNLRNEIRLDEQQLPLKNGENFLQIHLSKIPGLQNGKYYLLEVSGQSGRKSYLKFIYRKK